MTESKYEYKNGFGQVHRAGDLPAIEYSDGTKHWYTNGKLHRYGDRPAIEGIDGYKSWFDNGTRHRETGPAIDMNNNEKVLWFLHGRALTTTQINTYVSFCQKMKEKKRIKAQKKIYFWWIQICYDLSHPSGCGQRMAQRNLAEYENIIKHDLLL